MTTIYEVARLAGVSPATVSRVFNGVGVSAEKAIAVRQAARQLKFTPNRTARRLRKQESEVIALVIPDIENPFFTELARGVEDAAQSAGYSVVLCNTDSQVEKESVYLQIAISEHMAGVILAAASAHSNLDGILAAGRPVVAVDRSTGYDIDAVIFADRTAAEAATEKLVQAGFQRIACITGPEDIETAQERALGWRAAENAEDAEDETSRESAGGTVFQQQGGCARAGVRCGARPSARADHPRRRVPGASGRPLRPCAGQEAGRL